MRGACISAYTLTVKPAGTVGMAVAGLFARMPKLGFGTPMGASRSATGCGGTVLVCPAITTQKPATPTATVADIRERFEFIEVTPVVNCRPAIVPQSASGQVNPAEQTRTTARPV